MPIEIVHTSLFYQLAAILILAATFGFIALKLKQPLIIAFIGTGLLAGPDMLGIVGEHDHAIETLAELGIALLLFMVGLKLDLSLIKKLGPVALATGAAQVILTACLGTLVGIISGMALSTALFLGIALSFSSTIIVVKLLSDKRAIDSLYGKISLGVLIIQDIAVILSMVIVSAIGASEDSGLQLTDVTGIFVKITALIIGTGLFIRFIADPLTHALSRAPELMVIFAIGLASTMAALCHYFELSKELGGLLAGVALASTAHHNVIAARLAPLRDFLLLFFFVGLGSHISLGALGGQMGSALMLSLFVLLGKPLIIMSIMGVMGYRKRTGFLAGLSLGQISEFSLIFATMGFDAGIITENTVAMITLTGLITIGLSTYLIIHADWLEEKLERYLGLFERKNPRFKNEEEQKNLEGSYDTLIFGLGRYGLAMARQFQQENNTVLGVDFDPQAVKSAENHGVRAVYGDASDPELTGQLPLKDTRTVVFAFQHHMTGPLMADLRLTLAKILREHGFRGNIVSTSHYRAEEGNLKHHGVDIVLCPYEDAACRGAEIVMSTVNKKEDTAPS